MASLRIYVPSRALLRALTRPQAPRCPFARPLATPLTRGKRTKAAKKKDELESLQREAERFGPAYMKALEKKLYKELEDEKPLTDEELEHPGHPTINWYVQDIDKGTPKQLVQSIATAEDRKRVQKIYFMRKEARENPDYDDAELRRMMMDDMIANPEFASVADELKKMKAMIRSKEEQAEFEAQGMTLEQQAKREFNEAFKLGTKQSLEELLEDPAAAAAKEELVEALDKLADVESTVDPKFQAAMSKLVDKLNNDSTYQQKMATMPEYTEETAKAEFERGLEEIAAEHEPKPAAELETDIDIQDVDKLLYQMRDLLKAMGGGGGLEAEIDAVLADDPTAIQEIDPERGMDIGDLTTELIKMAKAASPHSKDPNADEPVSFELQAKVDKIIGDPKLLEKLSYIQQLMDEAKHAQMDITNIDHEVAPDPYELEDSRTATLKQRMKAARKDPDHMAALDKLFVRLPPPFGISPALKSFNQAMEFAYIGANDDIRRVLWRSYQKCRTLPTFLQNLSDDAWDIMYYSQAVTWGSNQNRQDHLRTILADLKSLGREGPPTHPSSLARSDDDQIVDATGNQVTFLLIPQKTKLFAFAARIPLGTRCILVLFWQAYLQACRLQFVLPVLPPYDAINLWAPPVEVDDEGFGCGRSELCERKHRESDSALEVVRLFSCGVAKRSGQRGPAKIPVFSHIIDDATQAAVKAPEHEGCGNQFLRYSSTLRALLLAGEDSAVLCARQCSSCAIKSVADQVEPTVVAPPVAFLLWAEGRGSRKSMLARNIFVGWRVADQVEPTVVAPPVAFLLWAEGRGSRKSMLARNIFVGWRVADQVEPTVVAPPVSLLLWAEGRPEAKAERLGAQKAAEPQSPDGDLGSGIPSGPSTTRDISSTTWSRTSLNSIRSVSGYPRPDQLPNHFSLTHRAGCGISNDMGKKTYLAMVDGGELPVSGYVDTVDSHRANGQAWQGGAFGRDI
ncbi:hypothetical protein BDU57DRAFT_531274 [Ampelomyces quisqualis]|uniref:Uncharacterized protein n=1 Tax=Ampelomyces quisqualis TaxID=50730 RepID=A0A6A5QJ38_AMPQU|nr:hypothetical protein BDU57DRAFT_531274 [Ampelomyces quisqualis]